MSAEIRLCAVTEARERCDIHREPCPALTLRQALLVVAQLAPPYLTHGYIDDFISIHTTRYGHGGPLLAATIRLHRPRSAAFTVFRAERGTAHDACVIFRPGRWTSYLDEIAAGADRIALERERSARRWLEDKEAKGPPTIDHSPAEDTDIFSQWTPTDPTEGIELRTERGAGLIRPGAPLTLVEGRLVQPGSGTHPVAGPFHPLTIPLARGEADRLDPRASYELLSEKPRRIITIAKTGERAGV